MYSVKPGRGPSLMGAIIAVVVGLPCIFFFLSTAIREKAPGIIIFFCFAFLVMLLTGIFASLYNATAKNRVSAYDITTSAEESDPFACLAPSPNSSPATRQAVASPFCPFCGAAVQSEFKFCPQCGKPQPESK
jgi:hypothetical protein